MNNLKLDSVQMEDLVLLQQISLQTFTDAFFHLNVPESFYGYTKWAFTKEQLKTELENYNSQFQFLRNENCVMGYFKLNYNTAQSDIKDPTSVEIERIYIVSEFQNQGLGKYLLDSIKKIAKSKNLQYIWLGVWEKNVAAIRFYEKNEFRIFSSHEFHMGSEIQTDLLMKHEVK